MPGAIPCALAGPTCVAMITASANLGRLASSRQSENTWEGAMPNLRAPAVAWAQAPGGTLAATALTFSGLRSGDERAALRRLSLETCPDARSRTAHTSAARDRGMGGCAVFRSRLSPEHSVAAAYLSTSPCAHNNGRGGGTARICRRASRFLGHGRGAATQNTFACCHASSVQLCQLRTPSRERTRERTRWLSTESPHSTIRYEPYLCSAASRWRIATSQAR